MRAVDKAVFKYRCPRCHRIVEKEQLFAIGCPLCGWTSPFGESTRACKWGASRDVGASLLEVFSEGARIIVLAEMPGFAIEEIEVKALNRLLIISAHSSTRRYYRRVMLPCPTMGKAQAKYKNGVLEVTLRKGLHGS